MTHYLDVLKHTEKFRGFEYHKHGGYQGPWIENLWIKNFMNRKPETFGPFVPLFIQWVDALHHVTYEEIQNVLKKLIQPDVMYVTVSQADFGLSQGQKFDMMKRFPNILVISAGGYGHVPIPLLKNEAQRDVACSSKTQACESRPYYISFVGQPHFGRDKILRTVLEVLGDEHVKMYRGDEWDRVVASSKFCLAPRGFGRTSFMMYESIQLETVPIYVYDDLAWLPYRDLKWDDFAVLISKFELEKLPSVLHNLDVTKMRHRMRALRDSHFTFDGVLDQIAKFLKSGYRDSDLRCETDIPKSPGLATFNSMSSLFATADANMDGSINIKEMEVVMKALALKTPNGDTIKVPAHELPVIFRSMDSDMNGIISRTEWENGGDAIKSAVYRLTGR